MINVRYLIWVTLCKEGKLLDMYGGCCRVRLCVRTSEQLVPRTTFVC